MKKFGMHMHSYYSDGKDNPSELAWQAKKDGLVAAYLTDHDVYHGIKEFMEATRELGILSIPAMEISCHFKRKHFVHILGYGIDCEGREKFLDEKLHSNWEAHSRSSSVLIRKAIELLDLELSAEEIRAAAQKHGPSYFSLPVAVYLAGRFGLTRKELTKKLLGDISPFEEPLSEGIYLEMTRAMDLIKALGGKAVLAHPGKFSNFSLGHKATQEEFSEMFDLLMDLGLAGLEVYYPYSHNQKETIAKFETLAKKCGLWMTAGSDYHGEYKPNCGLSIPGLAFKDFLKFKKFCES